MLLAYLKAVDSRDLGQLIKTDIQSFQPTICLFIYHYVFILLATVYVVLNH